MGITIHAKGKIDRLEDIPRLIAEVKGIAEENGWSYSIVDDDFAVEPDAVLGQGDGGGATVIEGSLGLKGIVLSAASKAESLAILFDRSGLLTDVMQQVFRNHNEAPEERFIACKTQFGCIDFHIQIIEVFDLLKRKYMTDLVINDEGCYWESRDKKILAEKRAVTEHFLRHAERAIGSIEISDLDDGEPEVLASQIEKALLKAEDENKSIH